MGHWWLRPKAYLHDRSLPVWTNREACYDPTLAARFDEVVAASDSHPAVDRSLPLRSKPHFVFSEREKTPLALRSFAGADNQESKNCFLASLKLIELIRSVDPNIMNCSEITQDCYKLKTTSTYQLVDAAMAHCAIDAIDRVNSCVDFEFTFSKKDGAKFWRVISPFGATSVVFRREVVGENAFFGLITNSYYHVYRLVVSDILAERIFASDLLGLELEDAAGVRKAPAQFQRESSVGWDRLYPA